MAQGEWREVDGTWWWYQFTSGFRAKGEIRSCERCGTEFKAILSKKNRFCGVRCASWLPRPRKPTEETVLNLAEANIGKRSDSPRFAPDQHGVMWEVRDGKPFTRATLSTCLACKTTFIRRKSSRTRYCSHSCAAQHRPAFIHEVGKKTIDREGYVWIIVPEEYPGAVRQGHTWRIKEHRMVMAQTLGRVLTRRENVHHRNGDRSDNRPENLELWVKPQPSGQRSTEGLPHCATCRCFGGA